MRIAPARFLSLGISTTDPQSWQRVGAMAQSDHEREISKTLRAPSFLQRNATE
jgi:hypothetical protein